MQISDNEKFLGEFLKPSFDNILLSSDLIVKYYMTAYDNFKFRKPFSEDLENAIII